jgi:fibronectin type 3 domain-containing protein
VQESTTNGGPYSMVGSTNALTYADTLTSANATLGNNTSYYYVVMSNNAGGGSANSTQVSGLTGPASPTGLAATRGNTQVTLNWTAATAAANYTVKRATTSGAETSLATGILGTSYTNTGLTNNTTYYYVVDSVNSLGTPGPNSSEVSIAPNATLPLAPTGVTATAGNANVTVSWTASTGASNYTIRRGTATGGPYGTTATVTTTTDTLTGLTNNTTYYFVVAAGNTSGTGANSNQTSATPEAPPAPPAAPTFFTATTGISQITLSWHAAANATAYVLTRGLSSGAENLTLSSNITGLSYPDTAVTDGTRYYYVVQTSASGVLSANSSEVSAIPLFPPPAAPTNLTAQAGNNAVALNWTGVTNATSYTVQTSATSGGPYSTVAGGVSTTSYTDTGALNGNTYYYVVFGADSGGDGADSNEAAVTLPPPAPTGLTAVAGSNSVALSWNGSNGAASYTIKRGTTTGGPYATVATNVSTTHYTDATAANGTTYFYVVVAVNAGGAGADSGEAGALPEPPAPLAPGNFTATPGNTTIALSWDAPANATSYTLARGPGSGNETLLVSNITNTTYTDTGLANGQLYYYTVQATGPGGTGPVSIEISAVPPQVYAAWSNTSFPGVSNTSITGPTANPAGDGLPNLLKYFYGLDPTANAGPAPLTSTADTSGNLTITFPMAKNQTGLTYVILESTDLINWTNTTVSAVPIADNGATYTMQASVPNPGPLNLYLKVQVAQGN